MPKTLVMIGNTSWGMLQFRAETIAHFLNSGHKVYVLAPEDESSGKIEKLGCHFIPLSVDRKGTNPIKDAVYFLQLLSLLLKTRPDVLLAYTIKPVLYAPLAGKLAGVPQRISITTGLGYLFSKETFVSKLVMGILRRTLVFATEVWFLNQDDQKVFVDKKLVPLSKTFILPGEGVNTDHYVPGTEYRAATTFTLVSRMLWDKGVGLFVSCAEALKKSHPELNFILVGPVDTGNPEGIPAIQLKEWHEKGIVDYRGPLEDIRPVLKETSCLVHPTYYREGIPRILMEASSMSLPCITTNSTGCRDVVKDKETGFLVDPQSVESLKAAILNFMKLSPEEREKLGVKGRAMICEDFSSRKINEIYVQRLGL